MTLHPLLPRHADDLFELVDRERTASLTEIADWRDADLASVRHHVRQAVRRARRGEEHHFAVLVGDAFSGIVVIDNVSSDTGDAELGGWLAAMHQGKGLARAALTLLVAFAAAELGLAALYVVAENEHAIRVATQLGFVPARSHDDERTHVLALA